MKKAAQYDEEAALLPRPMYEVKEEAGGFYIQVSRPRADPVGTSSPRNWRGHLLCCLSGCDFTAWCSMILCYFAPCLAFGCNMKKSLRLSAYWQAKLYLAFTLLAYIFVRNSLLNIDAQCQHDNKNDISPKCEEAWNSVYAAGEIYLILHLAGIMYFAHRRTQIREKFNIVGSRLGDFCAYFWCAPCALCQETRTLWHNNVDHGIWAGPPDYTTPATASTVPPYCPPEVSNMNTQPKATG